MNRKIFTIAVIVTILLLVFLGISAVLLNNNSTEDLPVDNKAEFDKIYESVLSDYNFNIIDGEVTTEEWEEIKIDLGDSGNRVIEYPDESETPEVDGAPSVSEMDSLLDSIIESAGETTPSSPDNPGSNESPDIDVSVDGDFEEDTSHITPDNGYMIVG